MVSTSQGSRREKPTFVYRQLHLRVHGLLAAASDALQCMCWTRDLLPGRTNLPMRLKQPPTALENSPMFEYINHGITPLQITTCYAGMSADQGPGLQAKSLNPSDIGRSAATASLLLQDDQHQPCTAIPPLVESVRSHATLGTS